MPVYRKGKKRVEAEKKIIRSARPVGSGDTRFFTAKQEWSTVNSSLKDIEKHFGFPLSKAIKSISKKRKNPVIVDWGCGKGRAISDIAKKFRNTKCYGFSDNSYFEWNKAKNVSFIHATAHDFSRYFKDGSIDLIYSRLGLDYLASSFGSRDSANDYIREMVRKLRVGGMIVCSSSVGYDLIGSHPKGIIVKEENFTINVINDMYTIIVRTK